MVVPNDDHSLDNTKTEQFGDPRTVEISDPNSGYCCSFCHKSEINPVEWGTLLKLDDIVTHHFCLLFSALVEQRGRDNEGIHGFMPKSIKKELGRGRRLGCKFCKKKNATIGCGVSKCPTSFHYSCGYEAGCLYQFYGQFQGYCPKHKPKQKIPHNICTECPICLVGTEEDEAIWPPCCGKRLFHRRCLMYTAKAAGYFFKCPLCNSTEKKFIHAMKANGVYIPQQDAAWELEPNAFQEQMIQYSRCDVKVCVCPKGREFVSKNTTNEWYSVRCSCCGASATHMKCSGLRIQTWKCYGCRGILKKSGADKDPVDLGDSDNYRESSTSDSSDDSSPEDEFIPTLPSINSIIQRCQVASGLTQAETDILTLKLNIPQSFNVQLPPSPPISNDYAEAGNGIEPNMNNEQEMISEEPRLGRSIPSTSHDFLNHLQQLKEEALGRGTEMEVTTSCSEGVDLDECMAKLCSFFNSKSLARKEARAEARTLENSGHIHNFPADSDIMKMVPVKSENPNEDTGAETVCVEEVGREGQLNLSGENECDKNFVRFFTKTVMIENTAAVDFSENSAAVMNDFSLTYGSRNEVKRVLKPRLNSLDIQKHQQKFRDLRQHLQILAVEEQRPTEPVLHAEINLNLT